MGLGLVALGPTSSGVLQIIERLSVMGKLKIHECAALVDLLFKEFGDDNNPYRADLTRSLYETFDRDGVRRLRRIIRLGIKIDSAYWDTHFPGWKRPIKMAGGTDLVDRVSLDKAI